MADFRSDKSDSREGKGVAKRAWDAYVRRVGKAKLPIIEPAVARFSVNKVVDLLGFWTAWHLHGGFEGLHRLGMSERTIYRQIAWFRMAFHEHPDTFRFPGITLDPEKYLAAGAMKPPASGKR